MKLTRMALALVALMVVAGLAYVGQQADTSGTDMVLAAQKFLGSLNDEQKIKAVIPFDSPERTNWHFVPLESNGKPTRKGLRLEEMTPDQKKAALALLRAGTSEQGDVAAVTIMSLESILHEQEKSGKLTRNPEWYFFSVFGTPSKTGNWGWRVEGHHLSLNFTLAGTQVVSVTPNFYGSNPAEIKGGPRQGQRPLEPTEQLAFELFKSLDAEQSKIAHRDKAFGEPNAMKATSAVGDPVGLPGAQMNTAQKAVLGKLLKAYTDRMPPDVGARELKRATDTGLEKIYFAFTGSAERGKGHTYRVQGPTFVIEFLNMQADSAGNPANHIHSVWRHIKGDFGKEKL
jgi:hypothetical protein